MSCAHHATSFLASHTSFVQARSHSQKDLASPSPRQILFKVNAPDQEEKGPSATTTGPNEAAEDLCAVASSVAPKPLSVPALRLPLNNGFATRSWTPSLSSTSSARPLPLSARAAARATPTVPPARSSSVGRLPRSDSSNSFSYSELSWRPPLQPMAQLAGASGGAVALVSPGLGSSSWTPPLTPQGVDPTHVARSASGRSQGSAQVIVLSRPVTPRQQAYPHPSDESHMPRASPVPAVQTAAVTTRRAVLSDRTNVIHAVPAGVVKATVQNWPPTNLNSANMLR